MGLSRTTAVFGGRRALVFLSPQLLRELAEGGRTRSRTSYIGPDRDYEMEALEEMGLDDIDAVDAPEDSCESLGASAADMPNSFDGWEIHHSNETDRDDPHEDLLQRIGALKRGGRR